jgi:hypothetical protein
VSIFAECCGDADMPVVEERHLRDERAAARADLARRIGEALARRDMASARSLIEEGAARFGHREMLREVEEQARQGRTQAVERHHEHSYELDDSAWWRDEPR